MPWKETCAMDERMRFIVRWSEEEGSFSALCREFGISRQTGYKWLERYEDGGPEALKDQAPVATRCPHRTPAEVIDRVVLLRKEHATWGPRKLRAWLALNEPEVAAPAASTIGDVLPRYGLVRPRRRRLRVRWAAATRSVRTVGRTTRGAPTSRGTSRSATASAATRSRSPTGTAATC